MPSWTRDRHKIATERAAHMSLWTPDGEHQVPREPAPSQPAPSQASPDQAAPTASEPAPASDHAGGTATMPGMPDMDDLTPEEQAQVAEMAKEMAEVREQLASVPASTVVANHAMGLYELGAIHLSSEPPNMAEASVAIDAMSAIVNALEGRLGEAEPTLNEAITQIQMVFVQLTNQGSA